MVDKLSKLWCTRFWHLSVIVNINFFSNLCCRSFVCGIAPDRLAFASQMYQWASSIHEPVAGSLFVIPWTSFDRYQPLLTRKTPWDLLFWNCSDSVIKPSQLVSCLSCWDPNTVRFLLLLPYQLLELTALLLSNVFYPLRTPTTLMLSVGVPVF